MKRIVLLLLCTIAFTNLYCQTAGLKKLAKAMKGIYDNSNQAALDTNFFAISLKITPIWKNNSNGYWFYVEQAVSTMQNKPYRQRVYHLTEPTKGKFESAVYTLNNPLRFAGKVNEVEKLTPDSLIAREGCSVFLQFDKMNKVFKGSTENNKCTSDLKGASYATSEVSIFKNKLISLDRGYDLTNKQVWGSTIGPYVFVKKK